MKRPLHIRDLMTASPHSIGKEQALSTARARMLQYAIRHLPVLSGGKLVGMVSERDLALAEAVGKLDAEAVRVEEVMSTEVFTAPPDALLGEVARTMADRKLGSAVIVDGGHVVGVFTTTDALRAVAQLVHA